LQNLTGSWIDKSTPAGSVRFDPKQQIPSLQVLRAIAACAVVYLHASNRVALTWGARSALSESIAYAGNGGVDMFFVLSGFLMAHLHRMYFYVLFAVAMLFRSGLYLLTMAMCASVGIGMLLHPHHPWLQLLTSPMLLEFLTGVGLAVLVRRVRVSARVGGVVLTIGVALLIFRAAGLGVLPIHVLIGLLWVSGCLAGVVCWKVVEKPMTDWLRRRTSSSPAIESNSTPAPLTVSAAKGAPRPSRSAV